LAAAHNSGTLPHVIQEMLRYNDVARIVYTIAHNKKKKAKPIETLNGIEQTLLNVIENTKNTRRQYELYRQVLVYALISKCSTLISRIPLQYRDNYYKHLVSVGNDTHLQQLLLYTDVRPTVQTMDDVRRIIYKHVNVSMPKFEIPDIVDEYLHQYIKTYGITKTLVDLFAPDKTLAYILIGYVYRHILSGYDYETHTTDEVLVFWLAMTYAQKHIIRARILHDEDLFTLITTNKWYFLLDYLNIPHIRVQ
jgi:hypothetical protein